MESRFWWDCLGRGVWCGVSLSMVTSLKPDFLSQQLSNNIGSWVNDGIMYPPPHTFLDFVVDVVCLFLWLELEEVLRLCQNCCKLMCSSFLLCVETSFLGVAHHEKFALKSFCPLFVRMAKTWSEIWMSDLGLSTLQAFIFCTLATWGSLCVSPAYC